MNTTPLSGRTLAWLIWAFMAAWLVMVVAIAAIIHSTAAAPRPIAHIPSVAALAAAVLVATLSSVTRIARPRIGLITSLVIGLTLAEAVSLIGLVYSLGGGGGSALLPFTTISAILLLMHIPR